MRQEIMGVAPILAFKGFQWTRCEFSCSSVCFWQRQSNSIIQVSVKIQYANMFLISTLRHSAIICLFLHLIFNTCDSQIEVNKFNVTNNSSSPTNITKLINLQEYLARFNMTRSSLKLPKTIEELNSQEMRKIKALQVKIQRLQQTIDNGNAEVMSTLLSCLTRMNY